MIEGKMFIRTEYMKILGLLLYILPKLMKHGEMKIYQISQVKSCIWEAEFKRWSNKHHQVWSFTENFA